MVAGSDTEILRRFNRSYTQRIGALEESFLGLGLPLGAARLVFEIGVGATTVHSLRARLGLDSGYLSRLLRQLEAAELVVVAPDPADRRRRSVRLTTSGRATWRKLDARSEKLAHQLVEPLTERQRARLTNALATADLLVRAATVQLDLVDPTDAMARVAVGHYFAELDRRFTDGFDPGPATASDSQALREPEGCFVVATSDGEPVACGGVQTIGPGIGEIKRMWVHEDWRGAGLGSRMLRRLEQESHDRGLLVVRLDTNSALTEAIEMYERAGYVPIERYNDNPYARHWFEKTLTR
ncbi:helix-turn-helix domain-containing GNAT family N-acetyltransferase [Nocardioides sp.]|uniref:bifunctional helix-turn-helix transcriptional regulator/GNAT family N-acetyltransferase n=1 Tax=Nocardioides sp. TaxID=35761 RepID=UPI0031FF21DA|nr:Transcriptional regulatory protein MarR [Nocardioides sp.]